MDANDIGKYGGYLFVQDAEGRWGVVAPTGEPLTPFFHRRDRPATGESIPTQLGFQAFRWFQYRSMHWVIEAVQTGSLAVMAGKLHPVGGERTRGLSPWGTADEAQVRLLRDLPPPSPPNEDLELCGEQTFTWFSYLDSPDIQTHCPIGTFRHGLFETIPIPWDALALDLPTRVFIDDDDLAEYGRLAAPEHVAALEHLIDALMELLDALDQFADPSELGSGSGDTLDARFCANRMRGIAMNLLIGIKIPREPRLRQMLIEELRENLALCDFPSILTRRRYDGREHLGRILLHRQSDYGYAVPFWIGDDGEKSAVATRHPWALTIKPSLDKAQAAYQSWAPMFQSAFRLRAQVTQISNA